MRYLRWILSMPLMVCAFLMTEERPYANPLPGCTLCGCANTWAIWIAGQYGTGSGNYQWFVIQNGTRTQAQMAYANVADTNANCLNGTPTQNNTTLTIFTGSSNNYICNNPGNWSPEEVASGGTLTQTTNTVNQSLCK